MSISALKCPFFSSTIEIVSNLKISKLQLANVVNFSILTHSWMGGLDFPMTSAHGTNVFNFSILTLSYDGMLGFSNGLGLWYESSQDFSI